RPWAGDDWPATVVTGTTKVDARAGAVPPPLPRSARPLRFGEGDRGDSRSQWSQGTSPVGSASEETVPLDSSQAGFPPTRHEEGLPRSVLIVVWIAVAAAMAVFAMILYQTIFRP